jgi:pimeloyl-ACP methyl ester carboxylesterase
LGLDDVLIICQHLKLTKFSILAHSAGAIYALATALRMPQHIRGRIHLLAPWIPPSQMTAFGTQQEALPLSALPYSQRLLRSLPTPFLRAANSSFLSTTSTSISTRLLKTPRHPKYRGTAPETSGPTSDHRCTSFPATTDYGCAEASISKEAVLLDSGRTGRRGIDPLTSHTAKRGSGSIYDNLLTEAIWNAATMGANPAVDLLVCLERRQSIGFRYVDIARSVVIHHGSKDTRVPVENVKWLGKTMRRCEVRILEGEGHGLMASAAVIGGVLMEMAKEWEDWMRLVQGKSSAARRIGRS